MIRKIIEAPSLPQPVSLSASTQGVPGVRTFGSARSGALADLDDGGFRRRSARTSVRLIDALNALSGFCSSAAAQSQPARSAGNVKKADLFRMRAVERMNRLGGWLQQDSAALFRKIRL